MPRIRGMYASLRCSRSSAAAALAAPASSPLGLLLLLLLFTLTARPALARRASRTSPCTIVRVAPVRGERELLALLRKRLQALRLVRSHEPQLIG